MGFEIFRRKKIDTGRIDPHEDDLAGRERIDEFDRKSAEVFVERVGVGKARSLDEHARAGDALHASHNVARAHTASTRDASLDDAAWPDVAVEGLFADPRRALAIVVGPVG